MTGPVTEADLHAFVDAQLDADRRAEIEDYLADHPASAARVARYAEQKAMLRAALRAAAEAPGDTTNTALEARLAAALAPPRRAWPRRAAIALLLVGGGWLANDLAALYRAWAVPAYVEEAAAAHEIFAGTAMNPAEMPESARPVLTAWLSAELGQEIDVPALDDVGLDLVGGRIVSDEPDPLAQLVYQDSEGYRLTLILSFEPSQAPPEYQAAEVDGLSTGYWRDGDVAYALVADTDPEQLLAIATLIGAAEVDPWSL